VSITILILPRKDKKTTLILVIKNTTLLLHSTVVCSENLKTVGKKRMSDPSNAGRATWEKTNKGNPFTIQTEKSQVICCVEHDEQKQVSSSMGGATAAGKTEVKPIDMLPASVGSLYYSSWQVLKRVHCFWHASMRLSKAVATR
jgi:hypothetical protein